MKVTLTIPDDDLRVLSAMARRDRISVGALIRTAVAADLARRDVRTDERLFATLRSALANDLADAHGWCDLNQRLNRHGYIMRATGGGIGLFSVQTGDKICKGSQIGYAHRVLARRFGEPMPGHPNPGSVLAAMARQRLPMPDQDLIKADWPQPTPAPHVAAAGGAG